VSFYLLAAHSKMNELHYAIKFIAIVVGVSVTTIIGNYFITTTIVAGGDIVVTIGGSSLLTVCLLLHLFAAVL
jgi:hypothetical protein